MKVLFSKWQNAFLTPNNDNEDFRNKDILKGKKQNDIGITFYICFQVCIIFHAAES